MTFIASVIAKQGIAIVADSLVTAIEYSIDQDDFGRHLQNKKKPIKNIPVKELIQLFNAKASYTRNYMDKLFQFGKWSAVTTSGQAYIDGIIIKELVAKIAQKMSVDSVEYTAKPIDQIIKEFCNHLQEYVITHLQKSNIKPTSFVFSHWDCKTNEAKVFNIQVRESVKGTYDLTSELVTYIDYSHLKIISSGQDNYIDRLIFGSFYRNSLKIKQVFEEFITKKIRIAKTKKIEIIKDIHSFEFLKDEIWDDMFSLKFRELSLQEAIDFAALLIKIVMDIQVYTEKIPTVGGLIRLAVIKEGKGYDDISGQHLLTPKIIS